MAEEGPTSGTLVKLLDQLGIAGEFVQKIKFGHGVVGKIAIVAVAALIALGAIGYRGATPTVQTFAIVLVGLIVIGVVTAILIFAKRHPDLASLEGAELILWYQLGLGAKGVHAPKGLPPVQDPKPALPGGEDENPGGGE